MEKTIIVDEVGPIDGLYYHVEFEATFRVEDNSFDYAGTHCTGGRSGTHVQFDMEMEGLYASKASHYGVDGDDEEVVLDGDALHASPLGKQLEDMAWDECAKHAPDMPLR